jgi:radical SAM protein with 4Fe4S-binding SPASM domain
MIGISKLYCGSRERSDALRYGEGDPRRSPGAPRPIVVWNCTRACNLRCVHCYSASTGPEDERELSTDAGLAMLEDLARFRVPVVLFSGGEPLMRKDLFTLIRRAAELGIRPVLSTNGTLIDQRVAERLREAGTRYVGVSLDGLRRTNDAFRAVEGAFDRALAGIRHAREAGIKVGLRFSMTRRNAAEIGDLFDLVRDEGFPRVCFYHLVYAGRGSLLVREDLDHEATRRAVDLIIDRTADLHAGGHRAEVLTVDNHTDGPYLYLRMVREKHPRAEEALRLLRRNGGNASGSRIASIGWDGEVYPDQFWRQKSLGNIADQTFGEIWSDGTHPLLAALRRRQTHLKGRCARCRFLDLCGGNFRARAEAVTGDPWAPDPACYLTDDEIGLTTEAAEE